MIVHNTEHHSDPAVDALLESLNHRYRRSVIQYFKHHTEKQVATVPELATFIHDGDLGKSRESVTLQLSHYHLPKLADSGWLDFDRQAENVRYRGIPKSDPATTVIRELLDD